MPNLANSTALNAKINEVIGEIPSMTVLHSATTLNDVKNNIADVSTLVKKAAYDTKIAEIGKNLDQNHDHSNKYITTQELNKLTSENFEARLKQANLATNVEIADFVKKTDFENKLKNLNKKFTSNKAKHEEVDKKLDDLTKKVTQISEKGYDFVVR